MTPSKKSTQVIFFKFYKSYNAEKLKVTDPFFKEENHHLDFLRLNCKIRFNIGDY
jgi:hypothetical protein